MDSEKDLTVTKMKHFVKLNERVQDKYKEMQRKLEKSKSVDSLVSSNDDNLLQENMKCSSINNVFDDVFVANVRKDYPLMHTVIIEDVNKIEVTSTTIEPKDASVSESEKSVDDDPSNSTDGKIDDLLKDELAPESSQDFLPDWIFPNDSNIEIDKHTDEIRDESTSMSPPPKVSFRNKIGSRVSAIKERRRESKEKNILKHKSEILDTGSKLHFGSNSDHRLSKDKRFKLSTVTIALIEVTGLDIDHTEERQKYLQFRFRLATEKYKSKIKHSATPIVKWQELFNLNMYDVHNTLLDMWLLDTDRKETIVGKASVDLSLLEKEKTHLMKLPLESMGNAEVFFLLTITGSPFEDLLVDIDDYLVYQSSLKKKHREFNSFQLNNSSVGHLSVIVYGAKGLPTLEYYCTLTLINERRLTHVETKTNEPNWMKLFHFDVTDITATLLVTVTDEKRDEEAGRVAIPLLSIVNGDKVWYALKDETLRERARGHNPRILLEMTISWNIAKASLRVIKPREVDFLEIEDRFDRKLFFRLVARAKVVVYWTLDFLQHLKTCFEWESRKLNTIWLSFWLFFNWYFSPWMVPLLLLIPFIWYGPPKYNIFYRKPHTIHAKDSITDKDHRTSLRQKINNLQDLLYTVQSFIAKLSSFGESVKNLFNFTVPYLSILAIFFIISISLLVYLVPVKYLFMGWAIKKYVRKIIWPHRVPHNEVLDLISRVPDDEDLIDCEMLPLELTSKDLMEDKDVDLFQNLFDRGCLEDEEKKIIAEIKK